ncbi:MAG: hypothetical protein M1608_00445 [Candidatus Omnitrophica bacterium]|nr:hypothetical protein [Candidatus Omnitrophota bacterium]
MESRVREFLATGRYRKARDELKQLCKMDRAKYLPLLIQANRGLIRAMIAKGQHSEAQQVLAYLKTIAPPAEIRALELELSAQTVQGEALFSAVLPLLADPRSSLSEAEKRRLADQVVLAFEPFPEGNPALTALAAEVQVIHRALQAVCEGNPDHALELVRPVPRSSMVSHWKIFVKGLAAFHSSYPEKGARLLSELPSDSVPAMASRPYLMLAGQWNESHEHGPWAESMVHAVCRLTGLSELGPILTKADQLWRNGNYVDSYNLVHKTVPKFPSEDPDWVGILSEFYLNSAFALPESALDEYLDFLESKTHNNSKNLTELMLAQRVLALVGRNDYEDSSLQDLWNGFMQNHQKLHGRNPKLASLAYAWLGKVFAEPEEFGGYFSPRTELRYSEGAIDALERSIDLDPGNLQAHLSLCEVYRSLKKTRERQRLLDRMTRRFRDNKDVLIQAGAECLERQAFVKGLDYLDRALELDRLNSAVANMLAFGRLKLAHQYFIDKRPKRARQALDQAWEKVTADPANLFRGQWCLSIQSGLLEQFYGDKGKGEQWLERARTESPSAAAFFLFAQIACRVCAPASSADMPFDANLKKALENCPSAGEAVVLVRIYGFWEKAPECPLLVLEEGLIRKYLETASQGVFTRQEAITLIEMTGPTSPLGKDMESFINRILSRDPQDPRFRIYHLLWAGDQIASPSNLPELESIAQEADRRGDDRTAQIVRGFIGTVRSMPPPGFAPYSPSDEEGPWGESDEFEPEFDEDEEFNEAEFNEMLNKLSQMSDVELRKVEKVVGRKIPPHLLNQLINAARSRASAQCPTPPPRAPTVKPSRKPSPPPPAEIDPDQLELF